MNETQQPTPASPSSPFHAGEAEVQTRIGVRDKVELMGRQMLRSFMPDQHRAFFEQLPWLVVGAREADGQPIASLLTGAPGFAHSPDPTVLRIEAVPSAGDPIADLLGEGQPIGLLGIELPTRRRNRMNGVIESRDANGLGVKVGFSFGNCPKYIQVREFDSVANEAAHSPGLSRTSSHLDAAMAAQVRAADTLFIATSHREDEGHEAGGDRAALARHGVDVSHRGGKPGFVHVNDEGTELLLPDFIGNFMFNTIGNLVLEPRAGLVFPDFVTGDLLHVSGTATIIWDGPLVRAFAGAQRVIRLNVTKAVLREQALPLRAHGAPEFSPVLAPLGAWPSVLPEA